MLARSVPRFNAPFDIRCRQLRRPLRFRRPVNEKLGNGGDKLRWRERLFQKDAVRNAKRGPLVRTAAGHVDNGESRINLSGLANGRFNPRASASGCRTLAFGLSLARSPLARLWLGRSWDYLPSLWVRSAFIKQLAMSKSRSCPGARTLNMGAMLLMGSRGSKRHRR